MLFYAADDAAAGDLVADLIRAGGYEPVRVGGLDQSIRLEVFGDLHEYGALGRVVTKSEALKAICQLPHRASRRSAQTVAECAGRVTGWASVPFARRRATANPQGILSRRISRTLLGPGGGGGPAGGGGLAAQGVGDGMTVSAVCSSRRAWHRVIPARG